MRISIERNYWKTRISLSQGRFAKVDRKNYDFLNQWKWHYSHGYAVRRVHKRLAKDKYAGTFIYMHRLIMGTPDKMATDHVNGDGLDNREENLRICTQAQNLQNKGIQSNNKSGYIGVYWSNRKKRWIAYVNGKTSLHKEIIEAAKARDRMAFAQYGMYTKLNFPDERYKYI